MRTLITNAYVLDMLGDAPNIQKTDILINENIIERIDKDIQIDEESGAFGATYIFILLFGPLYFLANSLVFSSFPSMASSVIVQPTNKPSPS